MNTWGGYMEVGDVVLSQGMKRYIIAARVDTPSEDYQIVKTGRHLLVFKAGDRKTWRFMMSPRPIS